MLLAFLLFGVSSPLIGTVALLPALFFAVVTLAVARPIAIGVVLRDRTSAGMPACLSAGLARGGSARCCLGCCWYPGGCPGRSKYWPRLIVVIISVILHGVSSAPLAARYGREVAEETLTEERESTAAGLFDQIQRDAPDNTRGTGRPADRENPPLVLDVRSRSTYDRDSATIPGSVRVLPDQVSIWADGHRRTGNRRLLHLTG